MGIGRGEMPSDETRPVSDLSGQRLYFRKGWRNVRRRNTLIRKLHRNNVAGGMPKMRSIARIAALFNLSVKSIERVVYG